MEIQVKGTISLGKIKIELSGAIGSYANNKTRCLLMGDSNETHGFEHKETF
jgi:hypothetical protein